MHPVVPGAELYRCITLAPRNIFIKACTLRVYAINLEGVATYLATCHSDLRILCYSLPCQANRQVIGAHLAHRMSLLCWMARSTLASLHSCVALLLLTPPPVMPLLLLLVPEDC